MKTKLKITENDVKKVCRDYMKVTGWFRFHILQGLGCFPGITDDIAIKNGNVLFIEYKRPGGKQRECQREFQIFIESHGGIYLLVKCLEDLIEAINKIEGR